MILLRIGAAVLLGLTCATAAPIVNRVEPPNWWTPHTLNPIQVLLTGSGLAGATVTTASRGFKIEVRTSSENGHYLFVNLDIGKGARPGVHRFQVKSASGTAEFDFTLE